MVSIRSLIKYVFLIIFCVVLAATGWYYYQKSVEAELPDYIASGNGRIEATEYDIATKYAGRLEQVLAEEGDMVAQDQLLASMNTDTIEAQLMEAHAGLREVQDGREYAIALLAVRQSELKYAQRERDRSVKLLPSGNISQDRVDLDNTKYETAKATLTAANIQVNQATSAIEAAKASIFRLQVERDEAQLKAPISGRVLYKLAQTGEILGSGGKVMTILDLTDVYMTVFMPTGQAGKIKVGSEARIILDAVSQYVLPATVSFVAPRTQFTPKAVETRTEREKLMFRVKVKIDPKLLKQYVEAVKTGVPGEAYILLDVAQGWPDSLQVKLP